jgi:hypothetical protein
MNGIRKRETADFLNNATRVETMSQRTANQLHPSIDSTHLLLS